MRKLVWVAAVGFGVGFTGLALAAATGGHDFRHWHAERAFAFTSSCRGDSGASNAPNASERHWAWDGGDTIEIDVPATVHYHGGEGDEVIVHGPPDAVAQIEVGGGRIGSTCDGGFDSHRVDITLPGRIFHHIGIAGSGKLVMENVNQPDMDLTLRGSGSFRAQGSSDHVTIAIEGSGDADLGDLAMKALVTRIAGSGHMVAAPHDDADVTIAGSGDVKLLSHPTHLNTKIMGSGRIIEAQISPAQ